MADFFDAERFVQREGMRGGAAFAIGRDHKNLGNVRKHARKNGESIGAHTIVIGQKQFHGAARYTKNDRGRRGLQRVLPKNDGLVGRRNREKRSTIGAMLRVFPLWGGGFDPNDNAGGE